MMRRRDFLALASGSLMVGWHPPKLLALGVGESAVPERSLRLAVDARLGPLAKSALQKLLDAAPEHPLLIAMMNGSKLQQVDTGKLLSDPQALAYNHVLLIALPDDPLCLAAWQREAAFQKDGVYVFGFGGFHGEIGYIEADRNPFLHAAHIKTAPFETEFITITGNSDAAIAASIRAFTEKNLVNGVVGLDGWKRSETTLLDRDPLAPDFMIPEPAAAEVDGYKRIGFTQAGEDEYRGVLEDTGVEPQEIMRFKYYRAGAWDGKGAAAAFDNYSYGLHRRAYGNMLWMARFASSAEASSAAPKIASAAKLVAVNGGWKGAQPAYGGGAGPNPQSSGPLRLWTKDDWVLMSTLEERKS